MRSDSGYFVAVISPRYPAAILALAVACALGGCAPAPEPSPTPTPAFASEEEAFAAAEEVYRAYNDAVNAERRGDEKADPRDFLIGLALEGDTDARRVLASEGVTISGDGEVAEFTPLQAEFESGTVSIQVMVCLDVSGTAVLDENGVDVTPPDRQSRVPLRVTLEDSDHQLMVSESTAEGSQAC